MLFAALLCPALLPAQEYRFEYLGSNQGLTDLAVRNLYQDSKGFIWISTENGVFRYDGERFLSFDASEGLPTSSGVSFGEAPDGALLVGGVIGLFRLDGNRFEPTRRKNCPTGLAASAQTPPATAIASDNGLMVLSMVAGKYSIVPIPTLKSSPDVPPAAYGSKVKPPRYGCGYQLCRFQNGASATSLWRSVRS